MIKKVLIKVGKFMLIFFIGVLTYNCSDDGADGRNGSDGKDGANGLNGAKGEGFEEATKYGSISATFTGKSPNNIDFTQTNVYKFTSIENINTVEKDGTKLTFILNKQLGTSASSDLTSCFIYFEVTDANLATPQFYMGNEFYNLPIIFNNRSYFILEDDWSVIFSWGSGNTNVNNLLIQDYSYNDQTKNLKFSFSYTVAANGNDSGHDLNVSGQVDVYVMEYVAGT